MSGEGDTDNVWRECVQWFIRCRVLDRSHRVTWPHANILEFAQILRDGVLVCQLANILSKGCIDMREVNLRPQLSQFLCLKNICVFLRACETTFELPQVVLFEAWQLYKVTDFGKVLETLAKLSTCPLAQRTGIAGFPECVDLPSVSGQHHEYYNDEIYRSLAEQAESKEIEEEVYSQQLCDEEYGKIYDVIVSRAKPKIARTPSNIGLADFEPKDPREHCIKELIDTERNYVEALNMMLRKFYTPLRDVLTPEDHRIVFMNIQDLALIHTGFQSELQKAAWNSLIGAPPSPPPTKEMNIGEIFLRWKPKFVAYSDYCSRMTRAQAKIDQLTTDSNSIRQKIVALVKHTPQTSEERTALDSSLDDMLDLSLYINEVKRDCEIIQLLNEVQNSIVDLTMPDQTDLADYGRLLKDGELRICSHEERRVKTRYVFVFDKVLMICKNVRGNQYTYKDAIVLGDYTLSESESELNNGGLGTLFKGAPKWGHSFTLTQKENENVFQMYTKSQEIKDSWMRSIQMAHDNVYPPSAKYTDHVFQYTTFPKATECTTCKKLLRGLFFQGYRCQHCPGLVHKECISGSSKCGSFPAPQRPLSIAVAPASEHSLVGQKLRTLKHFHGNNGGPEFLSFEENDLLEVMAVNTEISGWWKGRVVEGPNAGRIGFFPAEYVQKKLKPVHSESNCERPDSNTSLPPTTHSQHSSSPTVTPVEPPGTGYVNTQDPDCYPWFLGPLDREMADWKLKGLPTGTFLVRYSDHARRYAISISYEAEVKHVKVEQGPQGYWLDEGPLPFPSIVELVQYYEANNMQESFQALNTTLKIPLKTLVVGYAVAMHNFEPTAQNMVGLAKGDEVMILSKNGDERGWWKGKVKSKVGYFPLAYVNEMDGGTPTTNANVVSQFRRSDASTISMRSSLGR